MRHTFFKLWTHGIFQTPAETLISPELEAMLQYQIEKHLVDQGCEVSIVGGIPDHVHFFICSKSAYFPSRDFSLSQNDDHPLVSIA